MEVQNIFTEMTTKDALVDNITPAGSAFAATFEGEAVFINTRIVSSLKIKIGDHIRASVLPNYEDKRERVRWRAVRVEVLGSVLDGGDPAPVPQQASTVPKDQQVLRLLDEHGPLRTSTIGRLLKIDSGEAGALCHGLYAQGKIALADVYSSPTNTRASHRVWALDINEFDVDPFEDQED